MSLFLLFADNPKKDLRPTLIGGYAQLTSANKIIIPTLKTLIREKTAEFQSNPKVQLNLRLNDTPEDIEIPYSDKMIQRILSNLINNAIEAIDEDGSIFIDVQSKQNAILVSVIDFGKGIPPEVLSKLQKYEFQSHGKEHSHSSGTGIGLKSAFEELSKVGAKLHIESRIGIGTRIILEFPIQESSS
ncbi:MAG: sensor histidine kinase [Bacillota bacterium]